MPAAPTDLEAPPAALTIPSHTLEQWTGRAFTADQVARLLAALPDTTVPDTIATAAHALFGTALEWTADPDGEPGDLMAASQRIHGDNTAAYYTLIPVNGDLATDQLWTLHHTQTHDDAQAAVTYLGNHTGLDNAKDRAQLFEVS